MIDLCLYAITAMYLVFAAWHVRRRAKPLKATLYIVGGDHTFIVRFDHASRALVGPAMASMMRDQGSELCPDSAAEFQACIEAIAEHKTERVR